MRKITLFAFFITCFTNAYAQPEPNNFLASIVPQVAGSGTNSRLPVVYKAMVNGLLPATKYKFYSRAIESADFSSTTTNGAGNPIFFNTTGSWKTTSTASLSTTGGHDTFTTNLAGSFEGWFGFFYNANSRFSAGNYIYPYITVEPVGGGTVGKFYMPDSIKVLEFDSTSGPNKGTGIYGKSGAPEKYFVALYDNATGIGRPITITYTESEGITGTTMADYYTNNVEGKTGAWGSIIPNDLSTGIRRIELLKNGGLGAPFANTDANGIWGYKDSTMNRRGGLNKPVFLDDWEAPLTLPEIEFWTRTSNVGEAAGSTKVFVKRRYANEQNSTALLTFIAGTAKKGSDYNYVVSSPKTITFKQSPTGYDTTEITISDDLIAEGDEDIELKLTSPNNAILGAETAHTVIIKDDDKVNISFNAKSVSVKEYTKTIAVKVNFDKAFTKEVGVKVFLKSKSDSCLIPTDFTLFNNNSDTTIVIDSSKTSTSVTFNVKISNDTKIEISDTLFLVLRKNTGVSSLGVDSIIRVIILDDDAPSQVYFAGKSASVNESNVIQTYKLKINFNNLSQTDVGVRFVSTSSTATQGTDFIYSPTTQIVSFIPGGPDSATFSVEIKDDTKYESNEKVVFVLTPLTNAKIGKPDTFTLSIMDNDIPQYPISKITTIKADGTSDSTGRLCKVTGLVYGINYHPQGLLFFINDGTGGCQVSAPSKNFGYNVVEGDSVSVQGVVTNLNGMVQLAQLDTVIKLSAGNNLKAPAITNVLNESTESKLLKLNLVKLQTPSDWPIAPLTANSTKTIVLVTSTGTLNLIIDAETNIDGTAVPTGFLNILGMGAQNDLSSPYTSGYAIMPRKLSDIQPQTVPVVSFIGNSQSKIETALYSDSIKITANPLTSGSVLSYVVRKGGTANAIDYTFISPSLFNLTPTEKTKGFRIALNDDNIYKGDRTLILAIRNLPWGIEYGTDSVYTFTIKDDEPNSIKNIDGKDIIKLYPNPSTSNVNISSAVAMETIIISDLAGKEVKVINNIRSSETKINIADLMDGCYILAIKTSDTTYKTKLIKGN